MDENNTGANDTNIDPNNLPPQNIEPECKALPKRPLGDYMAATFFVAMMWIPIFVVVNRSVLLYFLTSIPVITIVSRRGRTWSESFTMSVLAHILVPLLLFTVLLITCGSMLRN